MTRAKRCLDLLISIPLAMALVPLSVVLYVLQRVTHDRGPLFYRGLRVGEDGRPFRVVKFRTMMVGKGGDVLTSYEDPRVTVLGRALRRSKVDELPQVWNVIMGEMTLVGPRPEDPAFVDWANADHRVVFSARPGMTGVSQLAYADEERLHAGPEPALRYRSDILPKKVELDKRYLASRTFRLDAVILVNTVRLVVRRLWPLGKVR